jgi:hypothetical protein
MTLSAATAHLRRIAVAYPHCVVPRVRIGHARHRGPRKRWKAEAHKRTARSITDYRRSEGDLKREF